MFKNFKTKNKMQKGFTIIEVMIVLAIAGLILVVVLIAIPQLQRNQRNNARQATMSRMVTEISNYAGNNNGQIPETSSELADFYERYLGTDVNTEDPTTGDSIPIILSTSLDGSGLPSVQDPAVIEVNDEGVPSRIDGGDIGVAFYQTSAACDGEAVITGQGGRNFVLVTLLEGGAIYCLDTK